MQKISGFLLRQGGLGGLPLFVKRLERLLRFLIGALNVRGFLRIAVQRRIGHLRLKLGDFRFLDADGLFRLLRADFELAQRLTPDVVLMDIRMPCKNGIDATHDITSDPALSGVHVLILTTFDLDEYVYDALSAGASGFLLKDAEPDEIVEAVRVVARGDALIQPSVMRRLVETFAAARPFVARRGGQALSALTEREREILLLVARGLGNDEIAAHLVISPATVKTHLARVMQKLDAHDRAQLVICAYEAGLVKPGAAG